ncbi:hypothetical protein N2152v2_003017 [Parachlorella kessleri]
MFGRNSLFGSFFGTGNDPRFRDPFEQVDNLMGTFFNDPFFRHLQPPAQLQAQQPYPAQQRPVLGSQGRTVEVGGREGLPPGGYPGHDPQPATHAAAGPTIHELDEDTHHQLAPHFGASQPDTVEEPEEEGEGEDDRGGPGGSQHQPQGQGSAFDAPLAQAPTPGGGQGAFAAVGGASFHRQADKVTVRTGGRGGMHFSRTQTTRMGPGGVGETQEEVHDGRTGHRSVTHTRRLGQKGRTARHVHDPSGQVHSQDYLHNIDEQEAGHFDDAWAQHAQRAGLQGASAQRLPAGAPMLGRAAPAGAVTMPQAPRQGLVIEEYESDDAGGASESGNREESGQLGVSGLEEREVSAGQQAHQWPGGNPRQAPRSATRARGKRERPQARSPRAGAASREGDNSPGRDLAQAALPEKRQRQEKGGQRQAAQLYFEDAEGVIHIDDGAEAAVVDAER